MLTVFLDALILTLRSLVFIHRSSAAFFYSRSLVSKDDELRFVCVCQDRELAVNRNKRNTILQRLCKTGGANSVELAPKRA